MAAADQYANFTQGATGPASFAEVVTPSDSVDLKNISREVYVGTAGNVSVAMAGGGIVVFKNVPAGQSLPVRVTRVNATNTTASDIVAMS